MLRVWEEGAYKNIRTEEQEVTGGWKKLRNEELNNFHSSLSTA
jgi:hypothetical protein